MSCTREAHCASDAAAVPRIAHSAKLVARRRLHDDQHLHALRKGSAYIFLVSRSRLLEVFEVFLVCMVGSTEGQRIVVFVHRLVLLGLLKVAVDGVEEPIQVSIRLSAWPSRRIWKQQTHSSPLWRF